MGKKAEKAEGELTKKEAKKAKKEAEETVMVTAKKTVLGDTATIKRLMDDAAITALLDEDELDYDEDVSLSNVKLVVGFAGVGASLVSHAFPAPFPKNWWVLLICCAFYFAMSGVLQLLPGRESALIEQKPLAANLERFQCATVEDLHVAIGNGTVNAGTVTGVLFPATRKRKEREGAEDVPRPIGLPNSDGEESAFENRRVRLQSLLQGNAGHAELLEDATAAAGRLVSSSLGRITKCSKSR